MPLPRRRLQTGLWATVVPCRAKNRHVDVVNPVSRGSSRYGAERTMVRRVAHERAATPSSPKTRCSFVEDMDVERQVPTLRQVRESFEIGHGTPLRSRTGERCPEPPVGRSVPGCDQVRLERQQLVGTLPGRRIRFARAGAPAGASFREGVLFRIPPRRTSMDRDARTHADVAIGPGRWRRPLQPWRRARGRRRR